MFHRFLLHNFMMFHSSSVCRSRTRSDQKYQTWYLLNVVIGFLQTPSTLCCWANMIWSSLKPARDVKRACLLSRSCRLRFMPQHLRVVFMSTCAVVWGGYISYVVHRWSWVIPSVRILKKKITGRWWLDVSWHWPKQAQLACLGKATCKKQPAVAAVAPHRFPALQCSFSCLLAWDLYVVQRLYSAS